MSSLVPFGPPQPPPPTCRYGHTADQALAHVEELRGDDSRVKPVSHAFQRMEERDITFLQVLRVLRRGQLVEGPSLTSGRMWRMKYRGYDAGQDISVVVDLEQDNMGELIVVVTVVAH
jgi:hypothetical protein